jgi:diguanylate cyclase (GGDEF)-like protein
VGKDNKLLETPTSIRIKKRARDEFLIGGFIVIFLIYLSSSSNAELVESFYNFTRHYEEWELDEIIFGVLWLAIVSVIYGARRLLDIRTLNQDITRSAYYDALTELPNRNLAMYYLEQQLAKASQFSHSVAVIFLDFDNFKGINDRYGHDAGDQLIKLVSQKLNQYSRGGEIVARLGGDEFLIVAEISGKDTNIVSLVERIQRCQDDVFLLGNNAVSTNFSIGVAIYPQDGDSSQSLLGAADIAMYEAKRIGTGNVCFYTKNLGEKIAERNNLSLSLKHALKNDELYMAYQPIYNEFGVIQGYEALIRWKLDGQMVKPEVIIKLGEEIGLSHIISQWVMKTTFKESKTLLKNLQFLAINISAKQFLEPEFVTSVEKLTNKYDFDPANLELEITESSIITNFEGSIRKIKQLRDAGVKIMIDDFGIGYSSLYRLKQLHVDKLKIDRSFLVDALRDKKSNGIYRTIIKLARILDVDVVAEGVETKEQAEFLREFGSLYMQGDYFQKPVRAIESNCLELTSVE